MKTLEHKIEDQVVRWAKMHDIMVTKLNLLGFRSMPDRAFWLDGGKPLLIEFKRPGKHVTKLQNHTIGKLQKLGYAVAVHDNVGQAIQEILDRKHGRK